VQIVHRYHFASHLKRMSVIVRVQEKFLVFVKVNYAYKKVDCVDLQFVLFFYIVAIYCKIN
jgi:hypothetical protein